MGNFPDDFIEVVKYVASKLNGRNYAIRGTASLVLQGFDFNVADIDVLTNKKTALYCNKIFKEIMEEKVEYSQSDKFKSYFGKFKINDILIEICGQWQIKDIKGNWSDTFDATNVEVREINVDNQKVKVTNSETELNMYMLMGRWNVYHKLRRMLNSNNQKRLF